MRTALLFAAIATALLVVSVPAEAAEAAATLQAGGAYIKRIRELEGLVVARDAAIAELRRKMAAEARAAEEDLNRATAALQEKLDKCNGALDTQKQLNEVLAQQAL